MTPPATQPATEEEDEGTITPTGIVLRDPTKSSSKALGIYVNEAIGDYQNRKEEGHDQYISFIEDFGDWDEASFKKVDKQLLRNLRELLFNRDVYTPKDGTPIYKHLARLAVQPRPEWPASGNYNTPGTPTPDTPTSGNNFNTPGTPASGNSNTPSTPSSANYNAPGTPASANYNTPGTPAPDNSSTPTPDTPTLGISNTPSTPTSAKIETPTGTATLFDTIQHQRYYTPLRRAYDIIQEDLLLPGVEAIGGPQRYRAEDKRLGGKRSYNLINQIVALLGLAGLY